MEIEISVGKNRASQAWSARRIEWGALAERLGQCERTWETAAEWDAMDKDSRSRLKDVGGFVGAVLDGGRRKASAVAKRTLVTLDFDACEGLDGWDRFRAAFPGAAAAAYTTHGHRAGAARWRLVAPLWPPCAPEQYEPIARAVAEACGIDQADPTTYQPERLFYWPSASKDGEFWADSQQGEPLSPAALLASYSDWRDPGLWPRGEAERRSGRRPAQAGGGAGGQCPDPREKAGYIGAFCRAYGVRAALAKYCAGLYSPCGRRLTWVAGSSAGGARLYREDGGECGAAEEGLWLYSDHATDPAGGALRNAFDLVRIHRFGGLDAGYSGDPAGAPSHAAMLDLCAADPAVRAENDRETARAFDGLASAEADEPRPEKAGGEEGGEEAWTAELARDKRGTVLNTGGNAKVIMMRDPALKGKIWRNLFDGTNCHDGGLPWQDEAGQWTDDDDANLRLYMEQRGITIREKISDAFKSVTAKNARNPVADYLRSLKWDGQPRLDTLFIDYLGARDTELARAMTRKQLVAACRRALDYKMGVKLDSVLVLQGPQGIGKSTLLKILGGEWFTDDMPMLGGKDAAMQAAASWIMELCELEALARSDVSTVKSFLGREEDKFRKPYASVVEKVPRRCVFFATTNDTQFLKDLTGNRRFWVVPCGYGPRRPMDEARAQRDQIWAEAMARTESGEKHYLEGDLYDQAEALASTCMDIDYHMLDMLEEFLDCPLPGEEEWSNYDLQERRRYYQTEFKRERMYRQRDRMCVMEFAVEFCGRSPNDRDYRYWSKRVAALMDKMPGWERDPLNNRRRGKLYGQQRGWQRKEAEQDDI